MVHNWPLFSPSAVFSTSFCLACIISCSLQQQWLPCLFPKLKQDWCQIKESVCCASVFMCVERGCNYLTFLCPYLLLVDFHPNNNCHSEGYLVQKLWFCFRCTQFHSAEPEMLQSEAKGGKLKFILKENHLLLFCFAETVLVGCGKKWRLTCTFEMNSNIFGLFSLS